MKVTTVLDGHALNLLVSSKLAELQLRRVARTDSRGNAVEDLAQLITAYCVRELTGQKIPVTPQVTDKNELNIQFKPSGDEEILERFKLVILHDGDHIKGSPFQLQFIDKMGYSSALTKNSQELSVDAQHRVNIVFPHKTLEKLDVEVRGPEGECVTDVSQWPGHAAAVAFTPSQEGKYKIHLSLNGRPVEKSPYSILADFSTEEAQQLYIMQEDRHLFAKPIPFGVDNPVFRIVTKNISIDDETPSNKKLNIFCIGPGKAAVKINTDIDFPGSEACTVIPSVPGTYKLNILWKERHIQQSPITMKFKELKNTVAYQGLEICNQSFKIGEPYSFRLNSAAIGSESLEVFCEPSSGADISVTPINDKGNLHRCDIKPLKSGQHAISIKYLGEHIEGSPFAVHFEDAADAALCKMMEAVRDEGNVNVKVSTEGAGPGVLEASVQLAGKNGTVTRDNTTLTRSELDGSHHQFQFSLVENTACLFHASYNGRPIYGSPFKLVFGEIGKVRARGQGLVAGRAGEWNSFILQITGSYDAPNERPQVSIVDEQNQAVEVEVHPTVTLASSPSPSNSLNSFGSAETVAADYEIKYFPETAGKYKIDVSWGLLPVPGSPFYVECFNLNFTIQSPPVRTVLGLPIEFNIHSNHTSASVDPGNFIVDARSSKGDRATGTVTGPHLEDENSESASVYRCSLVPRVPGKYVVNIKWKRVHIEGSPFDVKVVNPPRPENVVVRGAGVQNGVVEKQTFVVETAAAGPGMLIMKASRSLDDDKKERIPILISRDQNNRRTLHAEYHPTPPGDYVIEILWANASVPGSPFKVHLDPYSVVVVADVHASGDDAVVANQWADETKDNGDSTVHLNLADEKTSSQDSDRLDLALHRPSQVELTLEGDDRDAVVMVNPMVEEEITEANANPQLADHTISGNSSQNLSVLDQSDHLGLNLPDSGNDATVQVNKWVEEPLENDREFPVNPDPKEITSDLQHSVLVTNAHTELGLNGSSNNPVLKVNHWADKPAEKDLPIRQEAVIMRINVVPERSSHVQVELEDIMKVQPQKTPAQLVLSS